MSALPALHHADWTSFREVVARAEALIDAGEPLIVVAGAPGTGKTHLLRWLETARARSGAEVRFVDRGSRITNGELACQLLLVDEAQDMGQRERLLLSARIGLGSGSTVVAATQPSAAALPRPLAGLPVLTLEPMTHDESLSFIDAVAALGPAPPQIGADAADAIAAASRGVPRLIRTLTNNAALEAALAGAPTVSAAHVMAAAEMLVGMSASDVARVRPPAETEPPPLGAAELSPPPATQRRPVVFSLLVAACAVAAVGVGLAYWQQQPTSVTAPRPAVSADIRTTPTVAPAPPARPHDDPAPQPVRAKDVESAALPPKTVPVTAPSEQPAEAPPPEITAAPIVPPQRVAEAPRSVTITSIPAPRTPPVDPEPQPAAADEQARIVEASREARDQLRSVRN